MRARLIVSRDTDPYRNLAREEALLLSLEAETEPADAILYLWQNENTVVIGRGQNAWRECRTELLAAEGGRLARRTTGGGAVFHDLGNVNFSFIVPRAAYDVTRQLSVVQRAVQSFGIDCAFSGRNDLEASGRKFSGNAFRFLRHAALHHGTLLVSADLERMSRYLSASDEKLKARGVASVRARVVNLSALSGHATVAAVMDAMQNAFAHEYGACTAEDGDAMHLPDMDALAVRNTSWDWNYGATLSFDARFSTRLSFGSVEICLKLEEGRIAECSVFTDAMDADLSVTLEKALQRCPFDVKEMAARIPGEVGEWLAKQELS